MITMIVSLFTPNDSILGSLLYGNRKRAILGALASRLRNLS